MTDAARTGVVLKRLVPDDAATLVPLVNGLNAVTRDPPVARPAGEVAALFADMHPVVFGFLALRGETAIGYAIAQDSMTTEIMERGVYLNDLFVRAEDRRQGIGRLLIDAVAAESRARGGTHVWWLSMTLNVEARGAYQRLGAIEEGAMAHALIHDGFTAAADRGTRWC